MKKYIERMEGYKATDANMRCQGFQFELGKWHEVDGEIEMCKHGFHFCVHPSGPWSYYSNTDTRIFTIEAEQVLNAGVEPGADFKLVSKRIRLVKEVTPGLTGDDKSNTGNWNTGNWNTGNWNTGDWNTGDRNTGDWNTGNWNTGNWNTGNRNTGDRNTGDWNTGNRNTGDRNTGNWNTGNRNTGNWNTGNRNTGNRNTGDWNTGNWNTGNRNTGDGNATNRSTGFFCVNSLKVMSFDVQTKLTHDEFLNKYPEARILAELLHKPDLIKYSDFKNIPGITPKKLKALHKKHLEAKK